MPATIVVEVGAGAVQEFPVEEEVFRVGSGTACKLRLPDGVEAHAATVEFRNGRYVVHNRGTRPLQVNGQSVPPQGFAPWAAGQSLQAPPGVVMRLRVDGDPAPARRVRPAVRAADLGTDAPPEPAPGDVKAPPKKASKTLQYVVIGLCAVALPVLLVANPNTGAAPESGDVQGQFAAAVKELREKEPEPEAGPNALWSLLESARAAELRGEGEAAAKQYARILVLLRQRKDAEGGEWPEAEQKAWKFVRRRLNR